MPPNSPYKSGCPQVEAAAMSLSMRSTLSSICGRCASVAAGVGAAASGASASAGAVFANASHDPSSTIANPILRTLLTMPAPCVRLPGTILILVAQNRTAQEILRARAGIAQALEFQFEVHAVARLELADHVDVAPHQHAHRHAATVVLRTGESFQQLAVHQRIIVTP